MADDGADQGRGEGRAGGLERPAQRSPEALDFSAGPENDFNRHGDKVVPQALASPQNTD
jgi:hypothetical protein